MGLDRGSKLRCLFVLGGCRDRCFQCIQITIDPVLRPFVAFGSQLPFQLCSLVTTLVPALQEVGLVGINETGSLLARARGRNGFSCDPPLNGSLCHTELESHLSTLHALFSQCHTVLIPSHSLGLTGRWCVLDGSCLGRVPFF